jgi:hypothetical protein
VRSGWNAGDGVAAFLIGLCAALSADDYHLSAQHWKLARLINHPPADRPRALRRGSRGQKGEGEQRYKKSYDSVHCVLQLRIENPEMPLPASGAYHPLELLKLTAETTPVSGPPKKM